MTALCLALLLAAPADWPLTARPEDAAWFSEARFGMFIHWGPVSLKGTEIGWSRHGPRHGRPPATGGVPMEEYDNLYRQFNPTAFDATEWVRLAQAAGMKYLVFTSRHHDGFSMFDTALSDYKITNSPYGRDIVKQLADACHAAGLRFGLYYSQPDWYHPDYRTERHAEFLKYMHGQVAELCSNYGRLDLLWFDGLGGTAADWDAAKLFATIRERQPRILINNRCGLPGDFVTPEQTIGRFSRDQRWETCMTICRQWAWKPNDTMKSLDQCLQTLLRCAGGDGNLLFNVGPMPTGEIEPRQADRLREMGAWLARYGESVYGTRGGPWLPTPTSASTCRDNTVYLHLFRFEGDTVSLPDLPAKVLDATLLTGGRVLCAQAEGVLRLDLTGAERQPIDTLVKLTLDRSAVDLAPIRVQLSGSLATERPATASNVFRNDQGRWGPAKAVDDDPETRWATDSGTRSAWLEVDLGAARAIGRVTVAEEFDRIRRWELQGRVGAEPWRLLATGDRLGPEATLPLPGESARYLRLVILEATDGPTIREFRVFER